VIGTDKDSLLISILVGKGGDVVSGEEMAQALGMSRVALHKRVEHLKAWGIPIRSIPRKGYVLEETPDLLIPPIYLALLKSRQMGRPYHYLEKAESTNRIAKDLAHQGAPHGMLVVAEGQTRGRGRLGRSWFSPKGENIYLSLILRPNISVMEVPQLTFLVSVALTQVIREKLQLDALIKWPNDVYIKGRKVAGILMEMETRERQPLFLVAGVGLNVNTPDDGFPPEISTRATSLMVEGKQRYLRSQLLAWIMEALEAWYEKFQINQREDILRYWREHNFTLGKSVKLQGGREGWAIGVTPQGALLVRRPGGSILSLGAGDVEVVE
jgi:BirA family biotin operon repressor/biotin-[acetyl-CoA-carboxylase] ligase